MKTATAYCLSWALYWIGDAFSRLVQYIPDTDENEKVFELLYRPYQWCMMMSDKIQSWGCPETGPWEEVTIELEEEQGEQDNVHQPKDSN